MPTNQGSDLTTSAGSSAARATPPPASSRSWPGHAPFGSIYHFFPGGKGAARRRPSAGRARWRRARAHHLRSRARRGAAVRNFSRRGRDLSASDYADTCRLPPWRSRSRARANHCARPAPTCSSWLASASIGRCRRGRAPACDRDGRGARRAPSCSRGPAAPGHWASPETDRGAVRCPTRTSGPSGGRRIGDASSAARSRVPLASRSRQYMTATQAPRAEG